MVCYFVCPCTPTPGDFCYTRIVETLNQNTTKGALTPLSPETGIHFISISRKNELLQIHRSKYPIGNILSIYAVIIPVRE